MNTLKELILKEWHLDIKLDEAKLQRIVDSIKAAHTTVVYASHEYVCMKADHETCINTCNKCSYGARI